MINGESKTELEKFLAEIREGAGTQIRLSPSGGEETHFTIEYQGQIVDAYVSGRGEQTDALVRLVKYLVAGAPHANAPEGKADRLRWIVLGEGGAWEAFRFMAKYHVSDGACFAADVVPERKTGEAALHIKRCLEGTNDFAVRVDDNRICVVKFLGEEQSPVEFGQFLFQTLYEELGLKASIGIGCEVKSFSEIASSYNQAVTAVRMSSIFHSRGEVHSYREYLLVKLLENVPQNQLREYMSQFRIENTAEIFEDPDMVNTAEEFLANSLNVSEASRNLFMHRNTLMYRLDKIERITGLDIRNFSDAVTFRVIAVLYKLLKL